MSKSANTPKGSLTATQLRVMEAIWDCGPRGGYAYDVWQNAGGEETAARTTILTVMQRLEERGWVIRKGKGRKLRFLAAQSRQETMQQLSHEFVEDFFGGSASQLVMSLLGSEKIESDEIKRLKALLVKRVKEESK